MKLSEFLKKVRGKEGGIIEYRGSEALAAVQKNGDALSYVNKGIFERD